MASLRFRAGFSAIHSSASEPFFTDLSANLTLAFADMYVPELQQQQALHELHRLTKSTKSSLSIAFTAPPAKSDGWIAWAINPTGTGMAGAQALIAFKQSDGSMTVDTYNISSYSSIVQSKIAFNVSEKSAEYSGALMKIFTTLTLPENATSVNQVWQVGGSVSDGMPVKHAFQPANLNAKGTLDFVTGDNATASPATTTSNSNSGGGGQSSAENVGFSRITNCNFGIICMLLFLESFVLCF